MHMSGSVKYIQQMVSLVLVLGVIFRSCILKVSAKIPPEKMLDSLVMVDRTTRLLGTQELHVPYTHSDSTQSIRPHPYIIVGLHTCGDLGPSILRTFIKDRRNYRTGICGMLLHENVM